MSNRSSIPWIFRSPRVLTHSSPIEQRAAVRVTLPFPAIVRGMDATGQRFTIRTTLESLSACGLYLRLPRMVRAGSSLFIVVHLSTAPLDAPALRVAVRGLVVRADQVGDGRSSIAVTFDRHRLLYTFAP
jgi:hypothetical protein